MVQLVAHAKSSTLYGRSYVPIFSAWWVTTILYNYGATLCELRYYCTHAFLFIYMRLFIFLEITTWLKALVPENQGAQLLEILSQQIPSRCQKT